MGALWRDARHRTGAWSGRRSAGGMDDGGGEITVFWAVSAVFFIYIAGFVVDGAAQIRAVQRAQFVAGEAARYLAAIASAEGRYAEAVRIVAEDVGNRSDDGRVPPEPTARTQEIVAVHSGLAHNTSVVNRERQA